MENKTFNQMIKEYDKRKDIHYYVYFSSATFTYNIDVMTFKKKSDIKNQYYKNLKYYNTYEKAKAVADKKTAEDKNIGHLIGRAIHNFHKEIDNIEKTAKNENISISQKENDVMKNLISHSNLLNKFINNME